MRYALAFIRSIFHGLWSAVATICYAIVMISLSPFVSSHVLYRIARSWCSTGIIAARICCGVKWRITGYDNLPTAPDERIILLVKHQSTMETMLIPKIIERDLAFVFKKEILKIPFFGWGIGSLDMIHIDRGNRAESFNKVVEQGTRILNKGIWVIMFPEGTRIPRGEAGAYKLGGTRLACATGASVVPIAVASGKFWPRKAFTKFPGTVDVSIGKPISSAGRTPEDLMEEVKTFIENEMHRLDSTAYQNKK